MEEILCFGLIIGMGRIFLRTSFINLFVLDTNLEACLSDRSSKTQILEVFVRYPRNGVTGSQWDELREIIQEVVLFDSSGSYSWDLEVKEEFSVASTGNFVDVHTLEYSNIPTK